MTIIAATNAAAKGCVIRKYLWIWDVRCRRKAASMTPHEGVCARLLLVSKNGWSSRTMKLSWSEKMSASTCQCPGFSAHAEESASQMHHRASRMTYSELLSHSLGCLAAELTLWARAGKALRRQAIKEYGARLLRLREKIGVRSGPAPLPHVLQISSLSSFTSSPCSSPCFCGSSQIREMGFLTFTATTVRRGVCSPVGK